MEPRRYHPLMIALHWLMFLLFVVALVAIEYREDLVKGDPQIPLVMSIHKQAGVLVFMLVWLRLLARLRYPAPAVLGRQAWQRNAAHAMHLVLYAVMVALPLVGVLMSQAGDHAVSLFGWTLPTLVAPNHDLHESLEEVHELLGNAVYLLVGVHVVAALWHHLWLRDDTMRHMALRQRG